MTSDLRNRLTNVTKWYAEWLAGLELDCPDLLDRMRGLALECASERYWRDRQETWADWRDVKRCAATEPREQVEHSHRMACLGAENPHPKPATVAVHSSS